MILVILRGHQEGKRLLSRIGRQPNLASNTTALAPASILQQLIAKELRICFRELEQNPNWADLLARHKPQLIVDATNPLDPKPAPELLELCKDRGIELLIVEREANTIPKHPLIHHVEGFKDAAQTACALGDTIFLTTGTQQLDLFVDEAKQQGCRVIVRVLPEHRIVKRCQDLDIPVKDIVAMQGPFSKKVNLTLLQAYKADVLVTKDSGTAGGIGTKLAAALALKLPVVVVKRERRPDEQNNCFQALSVAEVWKRLNSLMETEA